MTSMLLCDVGTKTMFEQNVLKQVKGRRKYILLEILSRGVPNNLRFSPPTTS